MTEENPIVRIADALERLVELLTPKTSCKPILNPPEIKDIHELVP